MDIGRRFKVAYANRPVLITGGASFSGSHLAEIRVDAGAVVTVADDLSSGQLENLAAVQSRVRFLKGDLREPEFAKSACNSQEIVFHLAAPIHESNVLKWNQKQNTLPPNMKSVALCGERSR